MGFWRALEAPGALAQIPTVWRDLLGQDREATWPLFQPNGRLASAYPCPSPGGADCPRRIVEHEEDDIEAVCSDPETACETISLTRSDIMVYVPDLCRLSERLAQALRIDPGFEAVDHRRAWVGTLALTPGRRASVFLALPDSQAMSREVAVDLAMRQEPVVLLVPTRRHVPQNAVERIETAGGHVVVLEDVVRLETGGVFETSFDLRSLFVRDTETSDTLVFRPEGEFWTLRFADLEVRLRPSKGLRYLTVLLREPGRAFSPFDLREAAGEGMRPPSESETNAASLNTAGDLGELADAKALFAVRQELQDLEMEIEEADIAHDTGRREALQDQKQHLLDYLDTATGAGGRGRRAGSPMKRARDQVRQAIRRSLGAIAKNHPPLHKHLKASLRFEGGFAYSPEVELSWTT